MKENLMWVLKLFKIRVHDTKLYSSFSQVIKQNHTTYIYQLLLKRVANESLYIFSESNIPEVCNQTKVFIPICEFISVKTFLKLYKWNLCVHLKSQHYVKNIILKQGISWGNTTIVKYLHTSFDGAFYFKLTNYW